ncbi:hypothetical protein BJY01DRAFT_248030 [Aspergillus pseudoustus]|uniref:Mid2 domain-containing protein n=1 Tax=Aspergillus pseudoustus TaxID=1810923 RepID=A0ABR4JXH7_9EURO
MWPSKQCFRFLAILACIPGLSSAQEETPTPACSLIGWYLAPSSTERLTAASPWVTVGDYAGECTTTDAAQCALPTRCQGNILTWDNGRTANCGTAYSCVTFTIFETSPAGLPSASSVGCWQNWSAWTVYRERPSPTTSSESSSTTTTTTTTTSTTEPTPTDNPEEEHNNSSGRSTDQGWIAGAVIGPVAGCAIVFTAAFVYLRRKKHQYVHPRQVPQDSTYYGPPKTYAAPSTSSEPSSADYWYAPVAPVNEIAGHQTYEMSSTGLTELR